MASVFGRDAPLLVPRVRRFLVNTMSSRGRCQIQQFSVRSVFAAYMLSSELGNGAGVEQFLAGVEDDIVLACFLTRLC